MPVKSKSSLKDVRKSQEHGESQHLASYVQRLEEEKTGLLRRVRALHSWAKKELETMRDQLSEVKAQKDRASKEEDLLNQLTGSILSLYVEMKDRNAAKVTEELDAEAQRLATTNPLILLTYLRTHLRVLLAQQEDHEQELLGQIAAARREVASMEQILRDRLGEAQARETQAEARAREAAQLLAAAEVAKDAAVEDTQGLVEQVRLDQMTLVQELRAREQELAGLRTALEERDRLLRQREMELTRVSRLESELQSTQSDHALDRKRLISQYEARLERLAEGEKRLGRLESEAAAREARVRELQAALHAERTSHVASHRRDDQARAARFEGLYQAKAKEAETLSARCKVLEAGLERCTAEGDAARERYRKLFEAVKKQADEQAAAVAAAAGGGAADRHVGAEAEAAAAAAAVKQKAEELTVVYYKDLVREKDRETARLLARIRRMAAAELQAKIAQRRLEEELRESSEGLAQLQRRLDRALDSGRDAAALGWPAPAPDPGGGGASGGAGGGVGSEPPAQDPGHALPQRYVRVPGGGGGVQGHRRQIA